MPIRPRPPLAWLRRALLAVLALLVLGLGALFWFGRAGQRPERTPASEEVSRAGGEVTLIGDDFDYTLTEEERPIFRIRGESIRADREETLYLDGVGLTIYDEQGRAYEVESKEASFSRVRNEGRLRGNVHLKGPSGLTLRAGVLQLREKGQVLISPRPVWIGFSDAYLGRAQRMRVQIPEEVFIFEGNVEIHSINAQPPVSLKAERMVYERAERLLRIENKVQMDRGPEHVQAQRLNGQLTADERSLTFLHALGGVTGRTRREGGGPGATVIRFSGEDLTVQFQPAPGAPGQPGPAVDAADVRKVELDGKGGKGRVSIETAGAGTTRTLTAARIETRMTAGVIADAQAFGGVEVREASPAGNRRLTGQRAQAGFAADGQLATVAVDQNVVFAGPDLRATGDKGNMDLATGKGEFLGNPAEAESSRGRLTAPRLTYDQAAQMLQASGGVRAVLEQVDNSAVAGTLGPGEGPVRVQAQEAFWRQAPQGFLFRGDVRAWRGESVLLAKELRADQSAPAAPGQPARNVLNATGGVKSLWIPGEAPAGKPKTQPIEVTSAGLVYRETEGVVVYSGDVRVEQTGRVLRCNELQVDLDEDRRAETMTCTGNTRLDDPQGGRSITADRAVYQLESREVEMFGDPVVMKDRGKNQVRGKRLVYHVEDGRVEVKGQAQAGVASGGSPGGE